MGNKIITEKDFWICTQGCVPAPLQGTQSVVKKKSGENYITTKDKATLSFIDFGCNKYMLLMALAAAALVVGAVVVGVLTVATGGAALIAIGALAGLAGAAFGAVVGGLLCGHKVAPKRQWLGQKNNLKIIGTPTITGDHKMQCPAGGTVSFAPQIKSWGQAIALAGANYLGKLMEGMMAGAAVGMLGAAWMGGSAAMSGGAGIRGLGQAGLNFMKSMPRNFAVNIIESFSKIGLGLRGIMGVQNTAATYGNTGSAGIGDFAEGVVAMEVGAYEGVRNIVTGQGTWQDYVGTVMMFAPVGQGKRDFEDGLGSKTDAENTKNSDSEPTKKDDAEASKTDEEGTTRANKADNDAPGKNKDGEAYEDVPKAKSNPKLIEAVSKKAEEMINNAKNKVDGYSNKKNGPCLSGVYDPVTGKTSFGTNFRKNVAGNADYTKFVENAHPIIKDRIKAQQKLIDEGKMPPETDLRAGAHSEIRALDAAIKAREVQTGKTITEADLNTFDLHNRHMPNNNPMHRCGNCSNITNGVNVMGNHN